MEIDAKHRTYVVMVPPCTASLPEVMPKFPVGSDSYNYGQMSEVLAIFNTRWVSAGSPVGREPYSLSSSKSGCTDPNPMRFTSEIICSALASSKYIESIEKENHNIFTIIDLDDSDDVDSDSTSTPNFLTFRGDPDVKKGNRRRA